MFRAGEIVSCCMLIDVVGNSHLIPFMVPKAEVAAIVALPVGAHVREEIFFAEFF